MRKLAGMNNIIGTALLVLHQAAFCVEDELCNAVTAVLAGTLYDKHIFNHFHTPFRLFLTSDHHPSQRPPLTIQYSSYFPSDLQFSLR